MLKLTRPSRAEGVLLLGLAAANVALNRFVPRSRSSEISAHLGTAALISALAWERQQPGRPNVYSLENLRSGIIAGLAVGAPIGTALTLAAFLPFTRRFFRDERIANAEPDHASYQFFARIPLATALGEEAIFRAAVPQIFARKRSRLEAEIISAGLFGLWHILPALERLSANLNDDVPNNDPSSARQVMVVSGTVAATAVAGFALSRLRDASGSIAAPVIVHAAINGGGFLGVWLSSRMTRAGEEQSSVPASA